jgi:1-acyl-sn-glycerol-3-phosphate acyltransferase
VIRTLWVLCCTAVATILHGGGAIVGAMLGQDDRPGSLRERAPRNWGRLINWAAGVTVEIHGGEHRLGDQHVFVANHVSWLDIPVVAAHLRSFKFVAKAELKRIPIFGRAAAAAGTVYIERENRKAAFEAYRDAAEKIHAGASVVVFAEGTRDASYALRPFKKGPFVLAIAAQSPIVPTLIYGTLHVKPHGQFGMRPGTVHVHFLEPIPTVGLTYADRDTLAMRVRDRMAERLEREHGVVSKPWVPRRADAGEDDRDATGGATDGAPAVVPTPGD